MNGITARQQEVLNFIIDFSDKNVYPPTVREIAEHFKFAIKAAQDHLSALQKKGYITNTQNHSRSISVVRDFKLNPYAPFVAKIPVLAKEINPEFSVFDKENISAYFMISEPFVEKGKNYFLTYLNENEFALIEKFQDKISDFDFKNLMQKNEILACQNGILLIGKICSENFEDFENSQNLTCLLSSNGEEITFSKQEILGIVKLKISRH